MKITFHGACHTVTGSLHEVQIANKKFLLDCGMFQGPRALARQINSKFDFDSKTITAVILSHGHQDHCGNLPNLYKQGFRGPIYTTKATAAISALMMLDSAKIQEEDAAYLNQKTTKSWQGDIQPLYTREDAIGVARLFETIEYRKPTDMGGFILEFRDAGHILGSSAMALTETANGQPGKTLVFTGDVGRPNSPVIRDPDPFTPPLHVDMLISECTYGGKRHAPVAEVPIQLAKIINETVTAGGVMIMPAFALGRTQSIVQVLNILREQKQIPGWLPVYVDSPLATRITEVFRDFEPLLDDETRNLLEPFDFPNLIYVPTPQESMKLNNITHRAIIIASSGMCEAGRVLHHLKHHIRDRNTTVLLPGFQAEGTLGRKIQDGLREVPILGDLVPLNARVECMTGLSAHGDGKELIDYCTPLKSPTLQTFLVHGEDPAALAHQAALKAAGFANVSLANRGQVVEL